MPRFAYGITISTNPASTSRLHTVKKRKHTPCKMENNQVGGWSKRIGLILSQEKSSSARR